MAESHSTRDSGIERRQVVRGAAVVGVVGLGYTGLAACGGGGPAGGQGGSQGGNQQSGGSGGSGDGAIANTSEIPVGGGRIFSEQEIVVTQPEQGEFKAFSAVCTHRGCTVDTVEDNLIKCPCHGSQYSIEDASVQGGPAPEPLPSVEVTVQNGSVVRQ